MEKPPSRTIFEIIGALVGVVSLVANFTLGYANNKLKKENQSQITYEKTMENLTELIKKRDEYYLAARQIVEADVLRDGGQIKSHINDLNILRDTFIRFLRSQKFPFFAGIDVNSIASPTLGELLSQGALRERLEEELDTSDLGSVMRFVEFAAAIDERWVVLESRSDFTLRSSPQTLEDNAVATFGKGTACRLLGYTREVAWYYVRVSAGNREYTGWVWKPLLSSPRQGPLS
jgi:hypothetical protein